MMVATRLGQIGVPTAKYLPFIAKAAADAIVEPAPLQPSIGGGFGGGWVLPSTTYEDWRDRQELEPVVGYGFGEVALPLLEAHGDHGTAGVGEGVSPAAEGHGEGEAIVPSPTVQIAEAMIVAVERVLVLEMVAKSAAERLAALDALGDFEVASRYSRLRRAGVQTQLALAMELEVDRIVVLEDVRATARRRLAALERAA